MDRRDFIGLSLGAAVSGAAAQTGRAVEGQGGHLGPITALAMGDEGVLSLSSSGVWLSSDKKPDILQRNVCDPPWRALSMAPVADQLYLGGGLPASDGIVGRIAWKRETTQLQSRSLSGDLIYGIDVDPSHRRLVAACHDGKVLSVETADFARGEIAVWAEHEGIARGVAFSPDGRRLASCGSDAAVFLGKAEGREAPKRLQDHTARVECLTFTADGKALASGSGDGKVRLHNVDGRLIRTYSGLGSDPEMPMADTDQAVSVLVSVSGEGSRLLAGTSNGGLYELALGSSRWKRIAAFEGDIHAVLPVGGRLVVAAGDGIELIEDPWARR